MFRPADTSSICAPCARDASCSGRSWVASAETSPRSSEHRASWTSVSRCSCISCRFATFLSFSLTRCAPSSPTCSAAADACVCQQGACVCGRAGGCGARYAARLQLLQLHRLRLEAGAQAAALLQLRALLGRAAAREGGVPLLQARQLGAHVGERALQLAAVLFHAADAALQEAVLRAQHRQVLQVACMLLLRRICRVEPVLQDGRVAARRRQLVDSRLHFALHLRELDARPRLQLVHRVLEPAANQRQLGLQRADRAPSAFEPRALLLHSAAQRRVLLDERRLRAHTRNEGARGPAAVGWLGAQACPQQPTGAARS